MSAPVVSTPVASAPETPVVKTVENSTRTHVARVLGVKAPTNAYMFYTKSRRASFKDENPSLDHMEIVRGIADEWKVMDADARASYVQLATEDKERFNTQLDAAIEEHGDGPLPDAPVREKKEKKTKRKTPGKVFGVKGAKNAYILFGESVRSKVIEENPDAGQCDILRLISVEWKKASATTKKRFAKKAETEKKRFAKELAAAMAAHPEKMSELPKKKGRTRGRSAYIFFCNKQRPVLKASQKDMSVYDQNRELGRLWKDLSDEEKAPFVKLSDEDKAQFEKEKAEPEAEAEAEVEPQNVIVSNGDVEEENPPTPAKKTKKTKRSRKSKVKKEQPSA